MADNTNTAGVAAPKEDPGKKHFKWIPSGRYRVTMPRGKAAAKAVEIGAAVAGGSGSEPKAKKPKVSKGHKLAEKFPAGETLRDLCKKSWTLGNVIGQGGFGLIYLASEEGSSVEDYVVKIEPISNGPLFCELHFYQRVAKPEMVDKFIRDHKLRYLGVPKYIAAGQHSFKGTTYRFMVMQRFSTDLQKIFENAGKQFSKQTVYALALRMLDALEYIHENSYVHADVKASNCLLGYKAGKPDSDVVYLVDYGLATKYQPDGKHKEYKEDPRKAHDGTIEFTSTDAHKGVNPSRRGDMEILGFCLLQWLCGKLPWEDKLADKNYVRDSKIKEMCTQRANEANKHMQTWRELAANHSFTHYWQIIDEYMSDIPGLMKKCFPGGSPPEEISTYLVNVKKLGYSDKPNYNQLRDIFTKGLSKLGIKDTWKLALPLAGAAKPSTSSPKKGVKRKSTEEPRSSAAKQKTKPRVTSPASPRGTPTPIPGPSKAKQIKTVANGPGRGRPAKPVTPQVKSPASRVKSPAMAQSPAARLKSPATVKSPAGRVTSPAARPKKVVKKTQARTQVQPSSPVNGHSSSALNLMSPKGDANPKKRKVRRKNVQMSEMSVQTSPGLKLNR